MPEPPEPPDRTSYLLEGRYLADKIVAKGEISTVYAGTDTWSGEQIAVRRLRADRLDREPVFRRIGERLFGATSARLVRAIAMGEDREGLPFLVTELLVGRTAESLGKVRWEVACEITRQAAAALAELAVLDLHHGNLRAATLFVAASSAGGSRVKLLDLGTGERGASAAGDVRALAAILHRLLVGRPPLPASARGGKVSLAIASAPPRLEVLLARWLDPDATDLTPAEVASELKMLVDAASDLYGGAAKPEEPPRGIRVIPRSSMIVMDDDVGSRDDDGDA